MERSECFRFHIFAFVYILSSETLLCRYASCNPLAEVLNTNRTANQKVPLELSCRTITGGDEGCISVYACKSIMYIIQNSRPLSQKVIDQLKSYQCGFENKVPKVCCPSELPNLEESDWMPPDVTKHKNIGLLNQDCGKSGLFPYSWMTLLSYETGNGLQFKCSGTILNDRYILTAAHCLLGVGNVKLLGVRVGERNLSTAVDCVTNRENRSICVTHQDLRIEKVIPHGQTDYENDIGLIKVERMNMTENVKPVCLPVGNLTVDNLTGNRLTVTGFGQTETGKFSSVLMRLFVPLVPSQECRKKYYTVHLTKNQMCAGGAEGESPCSGDSGGPLQFLTPMGSSRRYVEYGITSFGANPCGRLGYPGVYTKVENYMNWILDNMEPELDLYGDLK